MTELAVVAAIIAIVAMFITICTAGGNRIDTFTVTCDRCNGTNVNVSHNGFECRDCGAKQKI